jgi:DNA-directed RNA polymerase subunit RPC12/RpoP
MTVCPSGRGSGTRLSCARSMNVTYACSSCDHAVRLEFDEESTTLACPACRHEITLPEGAVSGERVRRCLVCPSHDLYMRKDFPQRLGVLLVGIGIVGSSIAWYNANLPWTFGILFATALADLLLFMFVGNALMCYRCGAQYRGVAEMETHGQFDLETHEKYRQIAARTSQIVSSPPT